MQARQGGRTFRNIFFAILSSTTLVPALARSAAPSPTIAPAVDGLLDAFHAHSVIALGDAHGMAQEEDFYTAVVRSPRFASEVGNVVVEFGDAAQQQTLDRYLSGEDVPYGELRKVWADTVGWLPTVTSLGYINFFAVVREVNRKLIPERRIRVWLGDPAVDWAKVHTLAEMPQESRDQLPADILVNLLAKQKKALLIYGTGHFYGPTSIPERVRQKYPTAMFLINPYTGFQEETCSDAFEASTAGWGRSALISPVRGSSLAAALSKPGCHVLPPSPGLFPTDFTAEQRAQAIAKMEQQVSGGSADALLYLGPARTLTRSPESPDLYLDLDFRREMVRRAEIMLGLSLKDTPVDIIPASPRYVRPYGGPSPK